MEIEYRDIKDIDTASLKELFLSVEWSSGAYPEKLAAALKNYGSVFSAWQGDKLLGLIANMDDGVMTAYVHYLLVCPKCQGSGIGRKLVEMTKQHYKEYLRIVLIAYENSVEFYKKCGLTVCEGKIPMEVSSLWT